MNFPCPYKAVRAAEFFFQRSVSGNQTGELWLELVYHWEVGVLTSGGNVGVCPGVCRQLSAAESIGIKFLCFSVCCDAPFMMCFSSLRSSVPYCGTETCCCQLGKTEAGIPIVLLQRLPCKTQL